MENKPKTIKSFIEDNKEHSELIIEAIKVYHKEYSYITTKICAVCDKELTDEELAEFSPRHFHKTCTSHKKYARHFMLDQIRKDLGFGECMVIKGIYSK